MGNLTKRESFAVWGYDRNASLLSSSLTRTLQIKSYVGIAHILAIVGRVSLGLSHIITFVKVNGLSIPDVKGEEEKGLSNDQSLYEAQ